jgi:hypothetical protein
LVSNEIITRGSVRRLIGEQAPVLGLGAKHSKVAALGKSPLAGRLWAERPAPLEHLFRRLAKKLRHRQAEFRRQPLNLLVKGLGQLYFGSLHSASLPEVQD